MTAVRNPFDLALRFNNNSLKGNGRSKSLLAIEAAKENKIGARAGKTRVFKAMAGGFKVKTSPTQLFLNTSLVVPKCRTSKRSSIDKTLAFKRDVNKSNRHLSSWKDKSLLSKLGKVDFKPGGSVSGIKDYTIPFIKIPFSTKNFQFSENEKEANYSR